MSRWMVHWVKSWLNVCALAAKRANILSCIRQHNLAVKEVIIPLCLMLVRPHIELCVWFRAPPCKKGIKLPECI